MTKINIEADCRNLPKNEFLKDFNVAFATGNAQFICDHVSEDVRWTIFGDKEIVGKEQFVQEIDRMKEYIADEIIIHHIISHDKQGATNGQMIMDEQVYAFCDIYIFQSASSNLITHMQSYVVKIQG